MIPFFFIGSRRSGTTLACHIINMHPQLYTPFERYIMWILYCIRRNGIIEAPPCGSLEPMLITLSQAGDAFRKYMQWSDHGVEATRTAFFSAIHNCRMKRGTGDWRKDLVAIGEKNPPEYALPVMQELIQKVFPEAKFIHVIRHPAAVCRSQLTSMRTSGRHDKLTPEDWESEFEVHHKRWVAIERLVLEAKKRVEALTIRYEDLCADPVAEANRIYGFLGVTSNDHIARRITNFVQVDANTKYGLAVPRGIESLDEIMKMYGYGEESE